MDNCASVDFANYCTQKTARRGMVSGSSAPTRLVLNVEGRLHCWLPRLSANSLRKLHVRLAVSVSSPIGGSFSISSSSLLLSVIYTVGAGGFLEVSQAHVLAFTWAVQQTYSIELARGHPHA